MPFNGISLISASPARLIDHLLCAQHWRRGNTESIRAGHGQVLLTQRNYSREGVKSECVSVVLCSCGLMDNADWRIMLYPNKSKLKTLDWDTRIE